ncbi:hypothetical protein EDB84DRAFT_1438142 [Lactarius hengduanensis]|nr:hypothetical protein EDB84DRAFT_1438142 [Lactarius hengduanensis]
MEAAWMWRCGWGRGDGDEAGVVTWQGLPCWGSGVLRAALGRRGGSAVAGSWHGGESAGGGVLHAALRRRGGSAVAGSWRGRAWRVGGVLCDVAGGRGAVARRVGLPFLGGVEVLRAVLKRRGGLAVAACCEPWCTNGLQRPGGAAGWRWRRVASHVGAGCWGGGRIEVPVHEGAAMACNVQVERENKKEKKKKRKHILLHWDEAQPLPPPRAREPLALLFVPAPTLRADMARNTSPPPTRCAAPTRPFVHHGSQHAATANPPRRFNTARKTFGPMPIRPCPNTPPPPTHRASPTRHARPRPPTHLHAAPKRQSDTARNDTPTPRHVAQHPADPPCPFKAARTAQPPPTPTPPRHGAQDPATRRLTADLPRRLNAARNTPPPADSPPRQDPATADPPRCPNAARNTPPPADSPPRQDPATADPPRRPNAARNTPPPADSPPRRANTARPRGKRGNGAHILANILTTQCLY